MESIKINATTLTYGKIYYVDGIIGDDTSGNGSKVMPYKTMTKAYNSCINGDAIYLVGKEGVNYNDYTTAINKNIDIIGDGLLSKISAPSVSLWSASTGIVNFYRVKIYGQEVFRGGGASQTVKFYNCVIDLYIKIFGYTSSLKIELYNCFLDRDPSNVTYGWNRDRGYFENCVILGGGGWGAYNTSSLRTSLVNNSFVSFSANYNAITSLYTYTLDSAYNISGITWENIGTGTNPDGSIAHIGIYGGPYALNWKTTLNFLYSNEQYYTLRPNLEAISIDTATPDKNDFITSGFASYEFESILTKLTTQQKPLTDMGNIKTVAVPDGWSGITIE